MSDDPVPGNDSTNSNDTSPELTPTPQVPTPAPTVPSGSGQRRPLMPVIAVVVALILVGASGFAGYALRGGTVKKQSDQLRTLNAQVADLQKVTYDLPFSAVKVSDCIPNMGSHYLAKDGDKEYGPFYLVNKQNKVIGVEFMAAESMYTPIPDSPVPLAIVQKNSSAFGMKIDHVEFHHLPQGHVGLEEDHIDVHLYTVKPEVVKNACN